MTWLLVVTAVVVWSVSPAIFRRAGVSADKYAAALEAQSANALSTSRQMTGALIEAGDGQSMR